MNQKYRIHGKLNAFDQLKLARRLAPAFGVVEGMAKEENAGKPKGILVIMALSMLNDADSEFIVNMCLSTVLRLQEGADPAKLMVKGVLMFDDITMEEILELTSIVIEENLGDFLNTALPSYRQKA